MAGKKVKLGSQPDKRLGKPLGKEPVKIPDWAGTVDGRLKKDEPKKDK